MRLLAILPAAFLALACTQEAAPPADVAQPEMGPMPVVTALYDAATVPDTLEMRQYSFTEEMAQALTAHEDDVDFDWRSWANDPQVQDIRFRTSESDTEGNRAAISAAFTYPGVGGGMQVTYYLCRRPEGRWLITNIEGLSTDEGATDGPVSIRPMLGLPAIPPDTCELGAGG